MIPQEKLLPVQVFKLFVLKDPNTGRKLQKVNGCVDNLTLLDLKTEADAFTWLKLNALFASLFFPDTRTIVCI